MSLQLNKFINLFQRLVEDGPPYKAAARFIELDKLFTDMLTL